MILSLFCGCGGLDAGFESAGFNVGLAYDINSYAIESWNLNRPKNQCARVKDISALCLADLDRDFGKKFAPSGIIGGPPCQSFSRANHRRSENDPRSDLIRGFYSLALRLHRHRRALDFIVMENVPELQDARGGKLLATEIERLENNNFHVTKLVLDAANFGVPQFRKRLFIVATPKTEQKELNVPPGDERDTAFITVKRAFQGLPEPIQFARGLTKEDIPHHPNHWCMKPKSARFFDGSLRPGYSAGRSFKTLSWDKPSYTVSYGHRGVHIHPAGQRRLSVFEAMKLQGFPSDYVLEGTLSSQIDQVTNRVRQCVSLVYRKN